MRRIIILDSLSNITIFLAASKQMPVHSESYHTLFTLILLWCSLTQQSFKFDFLIRLHPVPHNDSRFVKCVMCCVKFSHLHTGALERGICHSLINFGYWNNLLKLFLVGCQLTIRTWHGAPFISINRNVWKCISSQLVSAVFRCFDNTIALLAVWYSSAMKSEHLPTTTTSKFDHFAFALTISGQYPLTIHWFLAESPVVQHKRGTR